jgi:hypothetical protein
LAKAPEDHLPSKAPKRTGKRGVGPKPEDEPTKLTVLKPELLSEANKRKEKTGRLPGMEDAEIEELEDAARDYADIRDKRMKLTTSEVETKSTLLAIMKRHKKETYNHDGIEVKITHEKESVKVRIKKNKDEDED